MELFKEDIKRYFQPKELATGITTWKLIKKVFSKGPLWLIMSYRMGRWIQKNVSLPILRPSLKIMHVTFSKIVDLLFIGEISLEAEIGKGFYIGHYGSIWIGPVIMGDYCNVSQEVTIGIGGKGKGRGLPEIGNYVYVGPGAKVFGKIKIGNNVAIGANAVVSKNVADNAVMVGNPARAIGHDGSEGLIFIEDW